MPWLSVGPYAKKMKRRPSGRKLRIPVSLVWRLQFGGRRYLAALGRNAEQGFNRRNE